MTLQPILCKQCLLNIVHLLCFLPKERKNSIANTQSIMNKLKSNRGCVTRFYSFIEWNQLFVGSFVNDIPKNSMLKSFFLSVLLTLKQKNTSFPQQPSHEIIWCVWLHNNIRITFQAENEFYNESDMQKDFIAYLKFIYIFWCWVIMPRQNVLRRIGRKCWIIKSKLIVFMYNSELSEWNELYDLLATHFMCR